MPRKRKKHILLVENDHRDAQLRKRFLSRFQDHTFVVDIAHSSNEAERLMAEAWSKSKKQYAFLLVDLFLTSDEHRPENISDVHIDDEENGCKVAASLLRFSRKLYGTTPGATQQLRPVVYSASSPDPLHEARLRTKILNMGAYDFISCSPKAMQDVVLRLSDMLDLQEHLIEITKGEGWIAQIISRLGCGISVICTNSRIWFCSEKNAKYAGVDLDSFLDRVCWCEYHSFQARSSPCPECPAAHAIAIASGNPLSHPESYPFPFERAHMHRCAPLPDNTCPTILEGTRLLPLRNGVPQWVHVIASPIMSRDKKRVIGAVETVIDMHSMIDGYLDAQQNSGTIFTVDRIKCVLALAHWMKYKRAQVFELSEDSKELVGIAQVGFSSETSFLRSRLPCPQTLLDAGLSPLSSAGSVACGFLVSGPVPGVQDAAPPPNHIEFVLLGNTASGPRPIGLLAIDMCDAADLTQVSSMALTEEDISRLMPLANYAAHAMNIGYKRRTLERQSRHAETLRLFTAEAKENDPKDGGFENRWSVIKQFLASRLSDLVSQEQEVVGFHARILNLSGKLHLVPGKGRYALLKQSDEVDPQDPVSVSAKCFRTGEPVQIDCTADDSQLQAFKAAVTKGCYGLSSAETTEVLAWISGVRSVVCLPIKWGRIKLGTLAIQSTARDFFHTETRSYLDAICNIIAQHLGSILQEYWTFHFWESAAYDFRGPAQAIIALSGSILNRLPDEHPALKVAQGVYALSHYIHSKANSSLFHLTNKRDAPPHLEPVSLDAVWPNLKALFIGLAHAGRKRFDSKIAGTDSLPPPAQIILNTNETILTAIIYNVFENAAKACLTCVLVTVGLEPHYLVLQIDDDGPGIHPEIRHRLFDGVHRDFESEWPRGRGIGLKYSKNYADSIHVLLSPQDHGHLQGASFTIKIPTTST